MWKCIAFLMSSLILSQVGFADDLAIVEVGLQPAQVYDQDSIVDNPVAGQQLFPTVYVTYEGAEIPSFTVRINIDGELECQFSFNITAGDWVFYCASPWTVEPGMHTVEARLDTTDAVQETDENNNTGSIPYDIAGVGSTLTPTSTPSPSPSPTQTQGESQVDPIFLFALNWYFGPFTPDTLLSFLEDGTIPSATPSPTPGGPTPTPTSTSGGGETFDFANYFILASNSNWHYTGIQGAGNEDDFRWTVEATTQDVGGGKQATRIRTDTDEPTDEFNGNVEFWLRENNGEIFFYGIFLANEVEETFFTVPSQDILLTDPVLIGRNGLSIGDSIQDTGSATVLVNSPAGDSTLIGTVTSVIEFTDFVPSFTTPLGTFTNVLRMVIDIQITLTTPIGPRDFEIRDNTFFLKEGVGLVGQDQEPDPSDAQIQGIDEGTVSGVPVVAN